MLLSGCGTTDSFRIGCLTPLTGESANYGKSTKQGIDLAVSELNAEKYLPKPLAVIYEDDRMTSKDGVSGMKKLTSIDKVPVILGPFGSNVVLDCAPIANATHTVIISASATADQIATAGDYVFRIAPPNSKQGSDVAVFCKNKLGAKTAAVLFQTNDYGTTLRDAFTKRFASLGGKILAAEGAQDGASDFRAQLSRIKSVAPDVVFFPLHYKESALMLKQAKELGLHSQFISADGAFTEDLLKIAGDSAEGTFYSTMALGYGVSDPLIAEFTASFKKAYHQEPDVYSAYYYEVTHIVAQAIRESGYDSDKIKQYLYSMNGAKAYKGITGVTSFDHNGEVDKPFYIYRVTGGHFVLASE
jgi:branched-chain amino acid transport system substrate-binding protein